MDERSTSGAENGTVEDPLVSTAFALGWQIAELARDAGTATPAGEPTDELPRVSRLPLDKLRELRLTQIGAALKRMGERIAASGLTVPSVSVDAATWQDDVRKLHVEILKVLTASDFRLGKAYQLALIVSGICTETTTDGFGARIRRECTNLYSWLLDLKSALPPHAGEAVYGSLRAWEKHLSDDEERGAGGSAAGTGDETDRVISRQGEIWRALLSGEKQATDTLMARDYADAVRDLFGTGVGLLVRLPLALWLLVGGTMSLAILGLIAATVAGDSASTIAALGGLAAALGISWTSVRNTLGEVAKKLREPLLGAALDRAIVRAITNIDELPDGGGS